MNIIYLANGQQAYLKETIGNKFIVNKLYEVEGEYGMEEISDGVDVVVDVIYMKQPIEKVSNEIKELEAIKRETILSVEELENKKRSLQAEISRMTTTQINNQKFIVNRTELLNAKTLVLFPKDRIMPLNKNLQGGYYRSEFKISMYLCVGNGEEKTWGYNITTDGREGISHYLCEKYGILIDPTDEQVDEVIRKRVSEFKFSDGVLLDTPDEYLTPEMMERKNNYFQTQRNNEKNRLEKELEKIRESLKKYE